MLGPSPRAKSRVRFSKSYRYRCLHFVDERNFFHLPPQIISFCPASICSTHNMCSVGSMRNMSQEDLNLKIVRGMGGPAGVKGS